METNHSSSLSFNCWNQEDLISPSFFDPVMVNPAQLPIQISQPQPKSKSTPLFVKSPDADGCLRLYRNPGQWIEDTAPASHRLVKHLVLDFFSIWKEHEIGESIDKLTLLTSLTIRDANDSLNSLPNSMATLHNLHHLYFDNCEFEELPANMELLKMNLTHLTLWECNEIKSLPHSLSTLSNLTSLTVSHCDFLTELPPSLGQLGSLKHFSVDNCYKLKSLPSTMSDLLNLDKLSIEYCPSLTELPINLKVTSLVLIDSGIKSLPSGLFNLRHFECSQDFCSPLSFASSKESANLKILYVHESLEEDFVEYPNNFDGLDELILLDIQHSKMKCLPWSITQLSKLRFLLLPRLFALETLPPHLNDSIIISVQGRHVRKIWKQLKLEISVSHFPIPQEPSRCLSPISPPVHLKLRQEDLERWICDNNSSVLLVNMLELHKSSKDVEGVEEDILQFSNLTHLYLTSYYENNRLPDRITGLRHLTLDNFWFDFQSGNISKLSNLRTLDVIGVNLPNSMDLPVSLRYVSFIGSYYTINSLPDSIAKLPNLITLELSGCNLKSFPENLSIHTLKIDNIIPAFPVDLCHLEILHPVDYCKRSGHFSCDELEQCLTRLVNLETLSLTCYFIESLPSIARLHNLRVLELKDCFNLKQLPSDVDELIELHTLDISGTRIKSIPDNFLELPKLRCVILSKCCRKESLPRNSKRFIIDGTDEIYYEHLNYYDSCYGSSPDTFCQGKDAEQDGCLSKEKDGLVLQECEQGEDGGLVMENCAVPPVHEGLQFNDRLDVNVNYQNPDYNSHIQERQKSMMTLESGKEIAPFASSSFAAQDNHHTSENEQNNPQNDIKKGKPQKIYIAAEIIQELLAKKLRLVDAAKLLKVSRSTFKRRLKELNIRWPSSKEGNQSFAKKRRHDSETHSRVESLQQMVNSIDTNNENVKEYTIEANQLTLCKSCHENVVDNYLDPSSANVKEIVKVPQSDKAGYPPIEQQLDHQNEHTLSNIVHQDGNSETLTVKATYADDTVKFEFCLTNSMEQLEQEVGKRLKLEVGTYRIKYEDEDKDLIRMSCTSELEGLLRLPRSAGCNFVKLSICDERSQNGAQKRQKSEGSREHLPMKTEGDKCNMYSTRKPLPFREEMVSCILPFIERYTEVKDDGHCGFRAIALFKYHDEEKWLDVRRDLMEELTTHKELYKRALGAEDEFKRACDIVNYYDTPAPEQHWYEATCLGLVVATKYQKICTQWSKTCPTTFLPLESRLVDKFPTEYINMALVRCNHFIALHMTTRNIPLPRLMPLWISHCNDDLKPWFLSHFKKQLDDFANKLH